MCNIVDGDGLPGVIYEPIIASSVVPRFKWSVHGHIKWLQAVATVWGKGQQDDSALFGLVDGVDAHMAFMIVEN